ncbi:MULTISPECIES: DUF6634 family protein [unclassified Yoonia]|uniref:DUF6634 family protein n=1 Tax=unclassified Yoonia TaxID=2629118 RepID=UPI002AFF84E9|nr:MULTISPECIES: DUF6634 family protein [unclassified Yoonia]
MQYHSDLDQYRPFQHLIAEMLRAEIPADATAGHIDIVLPMSLTVLYSAFRCSLPKETPAATFALFLERLEMLDCASLNADDHPAPTLHGWSLVRRPTSLCSAIGYTTDHPQLRYGSPIVTSVVCRIDYDQQWLRTWNRFYRLEEYDASTLDALKTAGLLKSDVTLSTISGHRSAR